MEKRQGRSEGETENRQGRSKGEAEKRRRRGEVSGRGRLVMKWERVRDKKVDAPKKRRFGIEG